MSKIKIGCMFFFLQATFAFASGGDVKKQDIVCKGNGILVQTKLSQNVDGNLNNNAHVLIYDSARGNKGSMLTSFEYCTPTPKREFIDVKEYRDILMCGSTFKQSNEISPNQAGYYGIFFTKGKSLSFKLKCSEGECLKNSKNFINQVIQCD